MSVTPMPAQPIGAVPPQDADAEDARELLWAWAAGLFEGEGTMVVRKNGSVVVQIGSTDHDVLMRFKAIVGVGNVGTQPPGGNKRVKRMWYVSIYDLRSMDRVVRRLLPYFGERRTRKAHEFLAQVEHLIEEATFERRCPNCGKNFRPPLRSNASRQQYCSRPCLIQATNEQTARRRRAGSVSEGQESLGSW